MSDTDRIEQRVYLAATPERVWRALTDAAEFGAWFASELDQPFAEGRTVSMTCLGERFALDIVEMTPPCRLVWRWHPGWVDHSLDYTKEPKPRRSSTSCRTRKVRCLPSPKPASMR